MIADKYLAGLIDSDGYIGLSPQKRADGTFHVGPRVTIKQRKDRSKVLYLIAADWELNVYDDADTHCIVFSGKKALRLLERIKRHLVIKPDVAEFVLSSTPTECSEERLKELKKQLSITKAIETTKVKNYPSRKWLAGYFDGDGSVTMDKRGNLKLQFSSHNNEQAGLKLIQKVWGGSIHTEGNGAKLHLWVPYRQKNKVSQTLGYFGKNCYIKAPQVEFIMGHLGKIPKEEFKDKLSRLKLPASTK